MTNENARNHMNDTTAPALPAPNGHGASTGTTTGETRQADTAAEGATKAAPPSSKKKKKKHHQHRKTPASTPVESAATAAGPVEPVGPQPQEARAAAPIEQPATAQFEESATAQFEESATAVIEEPIAASIEAAMESLRLRMKIWTDPTTSKRYLMPTAFMRDIVNGRPVTDVMYAYAMRDDDTKLVTLTAGAWNALPFFYFQEDGTAPRAAARPVDVIVSSKRAP